MSFYWTLWGKSLYKIGMLQTASALASLVLLLSLAAHAQTSPSSPVRKEVTLPKLLVKVQPEMPAAAAALHMTGTVVLDVYVGKDGHVASAKAASGPAMLRQAAIDAVNKWVFQPGTMNGEPTTVYTPISVSFDQDRNESAPPSPSAAKPSYVLPPPEAGRPRISSAVTLNLIVKHSEPLYPYSMRPSISGQTVVLRVLIGRDGKVQDAIAIAGPDEMKATAVETVKRWEFKPYLLNGEPAEVETVLKLSPTFAN